MTHWIILPVVLPALLAAIIVLGVRHHLMLQRVFALAGTGTLLAIAAGLFWTASDGTITLYQLGDWAAPFGIVLVADRLATLMVLLTAILALLVLLYAIGSGWDSRGQHFHALFQFQLMGIMGAFLTGDAFNLFVFFEVLLIASYGLMIHAGGTKRLRAGVQYMLFNLLGSTLFLFALGTIYAETGTLNMADLAQRVAAASADQTAGLRTASVLLLMVFAVKAAILPAAISYIALVYIVHLEAVKMGMKGTSQRHPAIILLSAGFAISAGIVIAGATLWLAGLLVGALGTTFGAAGGAIAIALFLMLYVAAVGYAGRAPDLDLTSEEGISALPPTSTIFKSGTYYLLPIFLLMYLLMVERKSPGFAAFWSASFMLLVLLTQKPLKALFRRDGGVTRGLKEGANEALAGLVEGARNMIGLACAMAVAVVAVARAALACGRTGAVSRLVVKATGAAASRAGAPVWKRPMVRASVSASRVSAWLAAVVCSNIAAFCWVT